MGQDYSDEMLMAFADGELELRERERIEAALETDSALRERLRVFEETGRTMGALFKEPLEAPVPAHLLELVRSADVAPPAPEGESMWARLSKGFGDLLTPQLGWAAVAATAVFAVGLSLGLWLQDTPSGVGERHALLGIENNHLWAEGSLKQALETVSSGESRAWSGPSDAAGTIVPVLTFKDKTGRYCREYAVTGAPEARAVGIACRQGDGRWSIEIHTAEATDPGAPGTFRPASGGGIARLQALMTEMSAGEPLDLDQEGAVLRGGWR